MNYDSLFTSILKWPYGETDLRDWESRAENLCVVFGEERGHVVAAVTKCGLVSRVTCPKSGTRSSFSSGTKLTGSRSKSVQQ